MEQKRADNIISGTNYALSFTVLGRDVGARHPEMSAMGEEERAGAGVIKLAAIVALNCLYGGAILGGHMSKEVSKSGKRVKLQP